MYAGCLQKSATADLSINHVKSYQNPPMRLDFFRQSKVPNKRYYTSLGIKYSTCMHDLICDANTVREPRSCDMCHISENDVLAHFCV